MHTICWDLHSQIPQDMARKLSCHTPSLAYEVPLLGTSRTKPPSFVSSKAKSLENRTSGAEALSNRHISTARLNPCSSFASFSGGAHKAVPFVWEAFPAPLQDSFVPMEWKLTCENLPNPLRRTKGTGLAVPPWTVYKEGFSPCGTLLVVSLYLRLTILQCLYRLVPMERELTL
jgi:hypothetical protein